MTPQIISVYRIIFEQHLPDVLAPVRSPEGRFHHDGEAALYSSCTPDGARLALGYYARANDAPRQIVELAITGAKLFDMRDAAACAALSITYSDATVRWQNERADDRLASPWRISDIVRRSGADGMYYPSSSQPEFFHLVLFRWNSLGGAKVRTVGQPRPCIFE
ncbi:MAG: RES family NAD+ phosphorylase [Marinosulfonomonas sp.]|nr:RES family NAD+ phosphorylase [Marinosulfonomonas sp.]